MPLGGRVSYRDCIDKLSRAAGRELSDDEASAIYERIHKAALDIRAGRASPADVSLGSKLEKTLKVEGGSEDGIIQQAAARAAKELEHEAAIRERNAGLQLAKISARLGDLETNKAAGLKPLDAVEKTIVRDYSGRTNIESLEQRATGVRADLMRKIQPTWDALGDEWLGFFQDRQKLITLVRELRGENTGDAIAAKGAKAFHDAAEEARTAYNAAGGDVGRLDDWGMPQHHSQEKVASAAKMLGMKGDDPAANRQAWVDYMMPKMMKTAAQGKYYVDELTGIPWTGTRMQEFLSKAWDTIATDGIANLQPGERSGNGARANRHAEHRQIHFADADDVINYWNTFGNKTLVEILDDHLGRMSKDIAFIEHYGPNPDLTFQTLRDTALKEATEANPKQKTKMAGRAAKLTELFDYAAGRVKPSANPSLSAVADGIANLNSAGKLGGAALASFFGDKPTYEAVSHLNEIPMIQRWSTEVRILNPVNAEDRAALQRQGLMLESVRSGLNRFYEQMGGGAGVAADFRSTTGKYANAVMRLTGMTAINDFRKGAFGLGLFHSIGQELASGKDFADLENSDVRTLKNYGISKEDWAVWKLAPADTLKMGGQALTGLTPEAITRIPDEALKKANLISQADDGTEAAALRRNAIVKLLGAVNTESDFAIVTPGWKERAQFYSGLAGQRGTVLGEIARSALQFKSFPWAYFQRGMDLVANGESPASKAAMTAYLVTSTTLAGAMLIQTRDMLAGKDPRKVFDDRNWEKFWLSAFVSGGALGIYGDFLYGLNETRMGSGPIETIAGPTFGPLLELGLVNPLNAAKAKHDGKESHFLAKEANIVKGFTPGTNIWYGKAAFDHMIWQKTMESLSPGYLSTVRSRTLKDYGQEWWWRPGETAPERAPNLNMLSR